MVYDKEDLQDVRMELKIISKKNRFLISKRIFNKFKVGEDGYAIPRSIKLNSVLS